MEQSFTLRPHVYLSRLCSVAIYQDHLTFPTCILHNLYDMDDLYFENDIKFPKRV